MIKWLLETPPKVGSKWILRDKRKNPFKRERWTVSVKEVVKGWVQYQDYYGSFNEEPVRLFRLLYKEVKNG